MFGVRQIQVVHDFDESFFGFGETRIVGFLLLDTRHRETDVIMRRVKESGVWKAGLDGGKMLEGGQKR